jgi:hypothetical protein
MPDQDPVDRRARLQRLRRSRTAHQLVQDPLRTPARVRAAQLADDRLDPARWLWSPSRHPNASKSGSVRADQNYRGGSTLDAAAPLA